mmetsp:Transcript_29519/g.35948  ORF Transcript_29519/g.35948 Transcript_29519/m.35948 type:complete len:102 (-) Transcript_29519:79-384(-)
MSKRLFENVVTCRYCRIMTSRRRRPENDGTHTLVTAIQKSSHEMIFLFLFPNGAFPHNKDSVLRLVDFSAMVPSFHRSTCCHCQQGRIMIFDYYLVKSKNT